MAVTEGRIDVGDTSKALDTTIVVQSDGIQAHREQITISDPENIDARAKVTNDVASSGDFGVVTRTIFNHDTHFDSYARLRTAEPHTLLSSQLQYDEMALVWNQKIATNGTVVHDADGAFVDLNTTTENGSSVIRQSPYQRYQPGKSQYILCTYDPVATILNCRKRIGYFDDENGIYIEYVGTDIFFVLRSSTSGSVVETRVALSNVNGDKYDGTGPSGITLDKEKSQVLWIDLEWLGVGTVRIGFFHKGIPGIAHTFLNANNINKTYMGTANLPIRNEITNLGIIASAGKLRQICCAVASEGGFSEESGFQFSAANGTTTIAVTTRRAILTIRPKATFNGIVNRVLILPQEFGFFPQTNAGLMEVVYNGTLGGTPVFNDVNADSVMEFDIAATTVTGGITFLHSEADAGGQGNFAFSGRASGDLSSRYPIHLDIDGANPTQMSLVVTSFNLTCDAVGHIGWKEIR